MPCVVKVGWTHAGYGKVRLHDCHDFEDLATVIALQRTYAIAEPLIESEYEVRVVFIAPDYYHEHRRKAMGWKVNVCPSQIREEAEVTPLHKLWCDEIRTAFGGLDVFSIDVIVDTNGKEFILEVNGSAIGFTPETEEQNNLHLRELVAMKLREAVGAPAVEKPPPEDAVAMETKIVNLRNSVEALEIEQRAVRTQIHEERRLLIGSPPQKKSNLVLIGLAALAIGIVIGWFAGHCLAK
jgi:hypothetical protein